MKVAVFRKGILMPPTGCIMRNGLEEKNESVFGKCNNKYYHGHNYELIVKVIGEPDPDTGYVYDIENLKQLDQRECIRSV